MHSSSLILLTSALCSSALAFPASSRFFNRQSGSDASWTLTSFTRTCADDGSSCDWSFGIDPNDGTATTGCAYTVTGDGTTWANETSEPGVACGPYTVSSNWSGQFGAGNGFTAMAITNSSYIAYPSYNDSVLQGGQTVSPDESWTATPN